jgi:hypothetical protein
MFIHMWYNIYFSQVEFLQKLFIEKINIYETYHAGGVMRIQAKHPNGSWYTVWQTQNVSDIHSSRIFSPLILMTNICTTICVSTSFHHKLSLLYIKKTNCHNIYISRLPSQSMYLTCIIHTSKCGENILLECISETFCVCHTVYQLPFGCLAWILITPPSVW